jgi:hypothetical protein
MVFVFCSEHRLELLELWQWTGLKWRDVANLLIKSLDRAIATTYAAQLDGDLADDKTPGQLVQYFQLIRGLYWLTNLNIMFRFRRT